MLQNEGRLFTATRFVGDVEGQWLENRLSGIGGSDVAAIMGLSPWRSPLEVYFEKTGKVQPQDISGREAVRMGVELEDDVLGMFRRRHPELAVMRSNASLRSVARPWAMASLDGVTRGADGYGVLKIKTGSKSSDWVDGPPLHYLTQMVHYLSVTGYTHGYFAALIGDYGLHYHEFRVERDEDDVRAVTEAVDRFWHDNVEADVPPAAFVGIQPESRAIWETYRRSDGDMAPDEGMRAEELAEELLSIGAEASELESRKRAAQNELRMLIGEHKGILTGSYAITWVRSEKRDSGIRVRERR